MAGKAHEKAQRHLDRLKETKVAFKLKDGREVRVIYAAMGIIDPTATTVTPRTDGGDDPLWLRVDVDGQESWHGYVNPPVGDDMDKTLRNFLAESLGGEV